MSFHEVGPGEPGSADVECVRPSAGGGLDLYAPAARYIPYTPYMIGQTYRHGWSARCAPLAQALVRPHKVGEADYEPDLPPVTSAAPGQTPGTTPQGCYQPTQGAIPPFHRGRLDRLPELP